MLKKLLVLCFGLASHWGFSQVTYLDFSGLSNNTIITNRALGSGGVTFIASISTNGSPNNPQVAADGNISFALGNNTKQCLNLSFSRAIDVIIDDNTDGTHGVLEQVDSLTFNNMSYSLTDPDLKINLQDMGSGMAEFSVEENISSYNTWNIEYDNISSLQVCGLRRTSSGSGNLKAPIRIGALSFSLPVELIDFKARAQKEGVLLQWTTASEIDNDFFGVERSKDGKNWETIAILPGKGNSVQLNHYQYLDENPLNVTSYYRLKQTDFDGSENISSIQTIQAKTSGNFSIFPNPVNNILTLELDNSSNAGEVIITDLLGNLVYKDFISEKEGRVELNLGQLKAGVYMIRFGDKVEKLIKS
ncbi:MAG: T9SS type A sorting domain-containing protein [Saprospiraceae bacterium]